MTLQYYVYYFNIFGLSLNFKKKENKGFINSNTLVFKATYFRCFQNSFHILGIYSK